jgi:hypothetical protein
MSTVERLRHDIDSGQTGDKVSFPDPAAAPLGADSEAGGASPTKGEIEHAQRYETGRSISHKPAWRTDASDVALVAVVTVVMCAAGAGLAVITGSVVL